MTNRNRIELRCTQEEHELIREKAQSAGLTVSEYIRRAGVGKPVKSLVDREAVGELRHIAAMLKHFYPKNANWSAEEKRRYWQGYERLMAIAAAIASKTHDRREDPQ